MLTKTPPRRISRPSGIHHHLFARHRPASSVERNACEKAILAFVENVTWDGSPDFVPAPQRIAVFGNDGTL